CRRRRGSTHGHCSPSTRAIRDESRQGLQTVGRCLFLASRPYFGSVAFPSRTKVNSFGGTVGPAGALPGTAPGAGGGALGSGGNTIPCPPRKATYCFPSSM